MKLFHCSPVNRRCGELLQFLTLLRSPQLHEKVVCQLIYHEDEIFVINLQAKPVGFAAPTSQAGGLFGGGAAPAATTGFGATAVQPTAGAFGAPAASTGFGFGATSTAPAAGGTGLFGQQAKPAFGAATTGQFLQFNRKMANRVQHCPDESTY